MNIDFLATVSKSSGTMFKPSGSSVEAAPGFKDQIDRAMRDNDRKNGPAVEKKPVAGKKTSAAAQAPSSVKTGEKAAAPKKTDSRDQKNTENKTAAVSQTPDHKEESAESEFASTGDNSGFYGELKDAETSETENAYAFTPPPAETSETENAYTPAPDDFTDSSVSFSADAQFFPPVLVKDDSGFAEMTTTGAAVENAVSGAGFNTTQQVNSGSFPAGSAEMATQMAGAAPIAETANVNSSSPPRLNGWVAAGTKRTRSSFFSRKAARARPRCPQWTGSKEPPSMPMRSALPAGNEPEFTC
jgi:hypothetical protein